MTRRPVRELTPPEFPIGAASPWRTSRASRTRCSRACASAGRCREDAVEESLRLEPAAAAIDRYATADTRLGEAEIAAGDLDLRVAWDP